MGRYIAVISAFTAFLVTSLLGFVVIPYLKRLKFGQTILDIGPKWHKGKQGTPTMGGVMMVVGVVFAFAVSLTVSLIFKTQLADELFKNELKGIALIGGVIMALCMCAIGFIDDYIKVVKKRNLGLTAKQTTFLQLLVSAAYLATLALSGMHTTYIPFLGDVNIISGIGIIFWPIALFFIYGFTNAVNLTDGLDGLASSVTLVVSCVFMLISGHISFYGANMLSAALAGACAGFIVWNAKPAKVFMGDTGSMFLGGMVVALSFAIGRPVLLILAGCMYLFEALSVMLQVAYFKLTGKRLFKMAPLHHHFEMCGFSEQKVVFLFSAVAFVGCLIAMLSVLLGW